MIIKELALVAESHSALQILTTIAYSLPIVAMGKFSDAAIKKANPSLQKAMLGHNELEDGSAQLMQSRFNVLRVIGKFYLWVGHNTMPGWIKNIHDKKN